MLNGGQLDGARILARRTDTLMASDHLGSTVNVRMNPGNLLLGTTGYTFGLGFLVRQGDGTAAVHGSTGEFMWAGYAGTFVWVDPKEQRRSSIEAVRSVGLQTGRLTPDLRGHHAEPSTARAGMTLMRTLSRRHGTRRHPGCKVAVQPVAV